MVFTVLPIFFFLILMFLKINSSSYWIISNEFKITFEIPKILVNGHGTFRLKKMNNGTQQGRNYEHFAFKKKKITYTRFFFFKTWISIDKIERKHFDM